MREGGAFLWLPACRDMDFPAVVVLPDASSSFLPPLDMHNTIPCPLPAGQRKVSSFILFFLEAERRLINCLAHYTIRWNKLGFLR